MSASAGAGRGLGGQTSLDFDHAVLPASDVEATLTFWAEVCGAQAQDRAEWRAGRKQYPVLHFGGWKLNVHPLETPARPRARAPNVGGMDICLVWPGPIEGAIDHLGASGVAIEFGPVEQDGSQGRGRSVYFRDPDGNLIEFLAYEDLDATR
jgi:catechol 2,3-dioxygenase-like lactoylglutathione lyase family enzyme